MLCKVYYLIFVMFRKIQDAKVNYWNNTTTSSTNLFIVFFYVIINKNNEGATDPSSKSKERPKGKSKCLQPAAILIFSFCSFVFGF